MDLSRFEKYEIIEIARGDLKNAPYNPRRITDKARKKLKEKIASVGLLEPPVWNARTGNIISGHQRLSIIDLLEGKKDYRLHVAKVDLDEKTEKEMVVFFNNPEAQGEWDLQKLEAIFQDAKIDFRETGFDLGDAYQLFGDSPLNAQPEQLIELSKQLHAFGDQYKEMKKKISDREDTNFYCVLVFENYDERKKFTDALNLEDNRYIDGRILLGIVSETKMTI